MERCESTVLGDERRRCVLNEHNGYVSHITKTDHEVWQLLLFAKEQVTLITKTSAKRIAELEAERDELLQAFSHTHEATEGESDACKSCGLDLRNAVHRRWLEVE